MFVYISCPESQTLALTPRDSRESRVPEPGRSCLSHLSGYEVQRLVLRRRALLLGGPFASRSLGAHVCLCLCEVRRSGSVLLSSHVRVKKVPLQRRKEREPRPVIVTHPLPPAARGGERGAASGAPEFNQKKKKKKIK